jgi:hemerythrin-like domain-containing protein
MPIDLLRQEHRTIHMALAAARAQIARMGESADLDAEAMNALVDFFKNFLDRCHFAKEERCLRQLLRTENLTTERHTMLAEHRLLRRQRRQLAAGLLAAEQGEDLAVLKILESMQAFVDLLQKHLEWEEGELYPLLDGASGEEVLPQLRGCFDRIKEQLPGEMDRYRIWSEGLQETKTQS